MYSYILLKPRKWTVISKLAQMYQRINHGFQQGAEQCHDATADKAVKHELFLKSVQMRFGVFQFVLKFQFISTCTFL